ncbi:accessory regulator AgrB, partial [Staphylococcus pseudintermedius]
MLLIDNGIEKMALKLQQRQNLSHIEFLKVRLGMQVVVINSFKAVVTYGLALLLNIFLYTLIVHLTFLALRTYSH